MANKQMENASKLRKNITIVKSTFEKVGLEVINVGVASNYISMLGGKGIRFYCEISADRQLKDNKWANIKINVYDQSGNLINMGSTGFMLNQFSGYDTIEVPVFDENLLDNAASAKVFLSVGNP